MTDKYEAFVTAQVEALPVMRHDISAAHTAFVAYVQKVDELVGALLKIWDGQAIARWPEVAALNSLVVPDPVDPLLLKARELAAARQVYQSDRECYLAGNYDDRAFLKGILLGLREAAK